VTVRSPDRRRDSPDPPNWSPGVAPARRSSERSRSAVRPVRAAVKPRSRLGTPDRLGASLSSGSRAAASRPRTAAPPGPAGAEAEVDPGPRPGASWRPAGVEPVRIRDTAGSRWPPEQGRHLLTGRIGVRKAPDPGWRSARNSCSEESLPGHLLGTAGHQGRVGDHPVPLVPGCRARASIPLPTTFHRGLVPPSGAARRYDDLVRLSRSVPSAAITRSLIRSVRPDGPAAAPPGPAGSPRTGRRRSQPPAAVARPYSYIFTIRVWTRAAAAPGRRRQREQLGDHLDRQRLGDGRDQVGRLAVPQPLAKPATKPIGDPGSQPSTCPRPKAPATNRRNRVWVGGSLSRREVWCSVNAPRVRRARDHARSDPAPSAQRVAGGVRHRPGGRRAPRASAAPLLHAARRRPGRGRRENQGPRDRTSPNVDAGQHPIPAGSPRPAALPSRGESPTLEQVAIAGDQASGDLQPHDGVVVGCLEPPSGSTVTATMRPGDVRDHGLALAVLHLQQAGRTGSPCRG